MTQNAQKKSKTTSVLEKIRYDLISGYFPPGKKLLMEHLRERYDVGFSPLREALSRLVTHGLVQTEELCGFYVPPLSVDELYDIYNVRIQIETLALELSMQHGDAAWESEVLACWHRYAKHIDPKSNATLQPIEWDALQKEFCITLIKACRSPWLLKIHDMLYDQASRYRFLCMGHHYKDEALLALFLRENNALVTAVIARDKEKAIQISQAGWDTSLAAMTKVLKEKYPQALALESEVMS